MFQLVASMSFALTFFVPVSFQNLETDAAIEVSTQVMESTLDGTEPVSDTAQEEIKTSASQRGQTGRRSRDRTRQDRDGRGRAAGRRRGEGRSGRGSSRRGRESKGRTRSNDRRSGRNPKRDRNRHSSGRSGSRRRGSRRRGSSRGRSDRDRGRGRGNDWSRRGESGVSLEEIHDMLEEILERLDELEERHEDEGAEEEERERSRSGRRGSDRDGQISSGRGRGRGRSQREQEDEGEEDSARSRSRRGSRGRGVGDNRDSADSLIAAVARRLASVVDRDEDGTVSEAELTRMPSRLRERFGIKSVVSMPVDEFVKKMIEGSANRPESEESVDERRNSPELANEMASRMGDAFDRNNDGTIDEEELARIPQSSRERLNIRGSSSKAEFTKRAAAVFLERMMERANGNRK